MLVATRTNFEHLHIYIRPCIIAPFDLHLDYLYYKSYYILSLSRSSLNVSLLVSLIWTCPWTSLLNGTSGKLGFTSTRVFSLNARYDIHQQALIIPLFHSSRYLALNLLYYQFQLPLIQVLHFLSTIIFISSILISCCFCIRLSYHVAYFLPR